MKQVRGRWVDYHLLWDGDNPKTMIYRTDDDVARLEFLRRKQQPDADWARDWSKVPFWSDKDFGIRIDKNDAFQAGRVSLMEDDELVALSIQMEETALHGTVDTDRHYWDGAQVKACLRSGKMLSYALRARVKNGVRWDFVSAWIQEELDNLPDLDANMLEAVNEVHNQGYSDALREILSGDIADKADRPRHERQRKACELVAAILRGWEAQVS